MRRSITVAKLAVLFLSSACSGSEVEPAFDASGGERDAAPADSGFADAGFADAGFVDSGTSDAGSMDASPVGPPVLLGLSIAGTRGLNPRFDAEIQRYSTIALSASSTISVTITATVAPGDSLFIEGASATSGESRALPAISFGERYTITVENAAGQRVYDIVYLPPEFPLLEVTHLTSETSTLPLYLSPRSQGLPSYVAIVDNHGVPTFFREELRAVFDFKLHPDGRRSYARDTGRNNVYGRRNYEQVLLAADFLELEALQTVGLNHTDQHEFLILPNGNYMMLSYNGMLRDLSMLGGTVDQLVEDSVIQEIDPDTQSVVFEWNSWGNLLYEEQVKPHPSDYAHVNSIFVDETDNSLIISARGTAQVIKIDRATGDVIWKLGGHSNEFTFINDPFPNLCGQHSVSRLPNGNLLIFDNGQFCWPEIPERGELTRVVEYALNESARTVELVWSYSEEGRYTTSQGSAQRLPNGNTLIGWGRGPDATATEVTPGGDKAFELVARAQGGGVAVSYRAVRYPR